MQRTKWIDRKFTFDFPEGWNYNILERLRGTTACLSDLTAGMAMKLPSFASQFPVR